MKKLSFILALLFLITTFVTACSNDNNSSESDDSSYIESNDSSIASDDNQSVFTEIAVSSNATETIVSNGASYTNTATAGESYPDTYGTELTDGIRSKTETADYNDEPLSGYPSKSGNVKVVIDLGYDCDKIYKFSVGYLATTVAGIAPPSSISVEVSKDSKYWENLGNPAKPAFQEGIMQEATLVLDEYVSARYIRFDIKGASAWVFLDELIVIGDVEGVEIKNDYLDAVNNAYQTLGTVARPDNGNEINREFNKVLVSKNAKYETNGTFISNFKDDGTMLTDGITSGYYQGETWVGFAAGEDVTVKIDLGTTIDDISSVEASFFTNTTVKLYMPVALKVAAIAKGGERTELGILYGNTALTNGNYNYVLPFAKTVSARYIEFTMVATESSMYLVEEFAVYAHRDGVTGTLYPPIEFDKNSTEWGNGASAEYTNLIAGKTQQILTIAEPKDSAYKNNTRVTSTIMTDGKTASGTDIHNGRFFKFNQGAGRNVIYDLDHISAVDKFTLSFTQITDWGVHAPSAVSVFVSNDGENWHEVGVITKQGTQPDSIYKYELTLNSKVKARYVCFSFPVVTWVGCDEIEIFGTKSTAGASEPTVYPKRNIVSGKRIEPSDDILGGAKDLCLLYIGDDRGYTVEDIMPYLAYIDENGEIKDTMFDSFVFLFMGTFPSGGVPYGGSKQSDWDWSLKDVFQDGKNIKALEEAAGTVKQKLGLADDFKYKVTLTLYYPSLDVKDFGDIDGDGKIDSLASLENRVNAVKKYIDQLEQAYNSIDFKNIELVGYYWFHETIESKHTDSKQMLNSISDYVHSKGKDFFWIPYFSANGYSEWAEYGFDCAVMQPNYVFDLEAPYSNVVNCAQLTQTYGMGLEMEMTGAALSDIKYFKKYMQYVAGGVEYGYMDDCIVMYYQSVYDFRDACNSKNVLGRMIYDSTYHFIKGDLKYKPDALENVSETAEKDTPFVGKLEVNTDKLHEFGVYLAPDHGSVTLNSDGTYVYYPEKGYTGEVKFSLV
ncbi:MAG: DUF4855 domain-containing protein, partial [Clostridia bacterium]|nr:DUF4855 domain-containing protein [Clostridia bacterium]